MESTNEEVYSFDQLMSRHIILHLNQIMQHCQRCFIISPADLHDCLRAINGSWLQVTSRIEVMNSCMSFLALSRIPERPFTSNSNRPS